MTDIEIKEEDFSDKVYAMTNEKLCEVVVANRYLGTMRDVAILCMEELARRRSAGGIFEYEKYIDDVLKTLPKFDLDLQKIMKNMPKIF